MTRKPAGVAIILALVLGVALTAQEKAATPGENKPDRPQQPVVPLKVQVVLSRYQGDKKTSALPFTFSVTAVALGSGPVPQTNVRMGAQIPVETGTISEGKVPSFQYKDVGTNIDCYATIVDESRFRLVLTIEDGSVYGDDHGATQTDLKAAGRLPAFRSFKTSQNLVLRDGQSLQYTTATDKLTGDVVKIDVTLNVIK